MIPPQVFSRNGGGAEASSRGGAARAPSASGLDDVFGFHPEEDEEEMEEMEDMGAGRGRAFAEARDLVRSPP